jgi:phosphatidylserine decarboxylase
VAAWFTGLVAGMLAADIGLALGRARRAPPVCVVERGSGQPVHEPRPLAEQLQIILAWGTVTGSRVLCRTPRFLRYLEGRSVRVGEEMDQPATAERIDAFLADYQVDVSELDRHPHEFATVNELFSRPLGAGLRPVAEPDDPGVAVSPADSRLTCADGDGAAHLLVKGRRRRVADLLGVEAPGAVGPGAARVRAFYQAASALGFSAAVCRLAPGDYHRFHWPVDGEWRPEEVLDLAGEYHSVAPVCIGGPVDVLGRNRRLVVMVGSETFGEVAVVVVGAVKVGSIELTAHPGRVSKGDEMGRFRYGGSTVVVVFRRDTIAFDPELLDNSARGAETLVRVGSVLGRASGSAGHA